MEVCELNYFNFLIHAIDIKSILFYPFLVKIFCGYDRTVSELPQACANFH